MGGAHYPLPFMSCDRNLIACDYTERTCSFKMASKAYVVAMTVSELKEELKQRGLGTKGSKRDLRDRLEQVRGVS